jgi:hypothetical protein
MLTEIDYDMADEILDAHNQVDPARQEDWAKVQEFARDFIQVGWDGPNRRHPIYIAGPGGYVLDGYNHQEGAIIDGWHRINAVIESGVAIAEYLSYLTNG